MKKKGAGTRKDGKKFNNEQAATTLALKIIRIEREGCKEERDSIPYLKTKFYNLLESKPRNGVEKRFGKKKSFKKRNSVSKLHTSGVKRG